MILHYSECVSKNNYLSLGTKEIDIYLAFLFTKNHRKTIANNSDIRKSCPTFIFQEKSGTHPLYTSKVLHLKTSKISRLRSPPCWFTLPTSITLSRHDRPRNAMFIIFYCTDVKVESLCKLVKTFERLIVFNGIRVFGSEPTRIRAIFTSDHGSKVARWRWTKVVFLLLTKLVTNLPGKSNQESLGIHLHLITLLKLLNDV